MLRGTAADTPPVDEAVAVRVTHAFEQTLTFGAMGVNLTWVGANGQVPLRSNGIPVLGVNDGAPGQPGIGPR